MAAGYVHPKPYPRWLDSDEDSIEKELCKYLESSTGTEEVQRLAACLYNAVRNGDYDRCSRYLREAGRSSEWTDKTLLMRIEKQMEAERRLADLETGSREAQTVSDKVVRTLIEEARSGAFSDKHYRELTTAVLKKGITVYNKGQQEVINDARKQIRKVLGLAEEGNAWAHDGLIDEAADGNEMVIHLLVQRARIEIASKDPESVSFGILAASCQDAVLAELDRLMFGVDVFTKLELCTETFFRVYKDLWSYEHKGTFQSWLNSILNNVIRDFREKKKINEVSLNERKEGTNLELQDEVADPAPGVEDTVAKGILMEDLLLCINNLPEDQRKALSMFYLPEKEMAPEDMSPDRKYKKTGCTYADLAAIMKTDESKIRKMLYNGRIRVRKQLIDMGYDNDTIDGLFK